MKVTGSHPRLVVIRVESEADVQQPERTPVACKDLNSTTCALRPLKAQAVFRSSTTGIDYAEAAPADPRLRLSFPIAVTASFRSECTVIATLSPPTSIHLFGFLELTGLARVVDALCSSPLLQ